MRLYEATLYKRRIPGIANIPDLPVLCEGSPVSREIVAETAGKARYSFWRDLREAWGDAVRIQDIRVLSLSKHSTKRYLSAGWELRMEQVNASIRVIGSLGRRFLSENSDRRNPVENPWFAHFTVDQRNEIWFMDRYTRKGILIRLREWPGFSDGGTLRDLVTHMAAYIEGREPFPMRHFGPAPKWCSNGDPWAYGDDMQKVRDGVASILAPNHEQPSASSRPQGTPAGVLTA